jgi:L-lactate dehydrogenase complex protein LldG
VLQATDAPLLSRKGEMSSKEELLSRIRQALGPSRPDVCTYPERAPFGVAEIDPAALVDQFKAEMERVGGRVSFVHSSKEVTDYLTALLPSKGRPLVAVSDGAADREHGLRDWLAARGADLLPSLREYAKTARAPGAGPAEDSLTDRYKRALFEAGLGITCADYAIADTGTLVIASKSAGEPIANTPSAVKEPRRSADAGCSGEQHRLISLVPPIHVCLLDSAKIVRDLNEFFPLVRGTLYQDASPPLVMTFITGPSRTADIELTLTMGVHGPRELHVLIYN